MSNAYFAEQQISIYLALFMVTGMLVTMAVAYVLHDYHRHKQPLTQADPNVNYSVLHHVRMVTIPLMKYRLNIKFERNNHIQRF